MRGEKHQPALHQGKHAFLQRKLCLNIQMRCGLVENEHPALGIKKRPCKRHALRLPARKLPALLTQKRVDPLGKLRHRIFQSRKLNSLVNVVFGRTRHVKRHVVAQRRIENVRVLRDKRDKLKPLGVIQRGNARAIDKNLARCGIREASKQSGQRCFTRPRHANNAHFASAFNAEIDLIQGEGIIAAMPKTDITELKGRAIIPAQRVVFVRFLRRVIRCALHGKRTTFPRFARLPLIACRTRRGSRGKRPAFPRFARHPHRISRLSDGKRVRRAGLGTCTRPADSNGRARRLPAFATYNIQNRGQTVTPIQAGMEIRGVAAHGGEIFRHHDKNRKRGLKAHTAVKKPESQHDCHRRQGKRAKQIQNQTA